MNKRDVKYINFNFQSDPELVRKLNEAATHERRTVHGLIKNILQDYLDRQSTVTDCQNQ